MKQIQAVIRREKLGAVKKALDDLHCPGMMVWEILGHGKQQGVTEHFRGREFKMDLIPKTKLQIVVKDQQLEDVISAILANAATGQIGDGKIFVSTIDETIRIRTGERGEKAVG